MVLLSWEPAAPPPCRLYRAPATPPLTLYTNIHISDSLNKVCTYLLRSSGLSWNLEISNQIETLFLETKKYLISSVYYHGLECLWTVSRLPTLVLVLSAPLCPIDCPHVLSASTQNHNFSASPHTVPQLWAQSSSDQIKFLVYLEDIIRLILTRSHWVRQHDKMEQGREIKIV